MGKADVVLSCGDISDQVILQAAQSYGCSTIFAVKGNHDTNAKFANPITDLHLQVKEYGSVTFGGLNGSWRYKPRGNFLYDQAEVDTMLREFPKVHVFLSHNSPRGIHDREDDIHCGFDGLNTYIERANPQLLLHGHQHVSTESRLHEIRIIGVYGHRLIEI